MDTVEEKRMKIKWSDELHRLKCEADGVSDRLGTNVEWLNNIDLTGITNKTRTKDQCKLRRNSMQSEKDRVDRIERELQEICKEVPQLECDPAAESIRNSVELWNDIFARLKKIEKDCEEHSITETTDNETETSPQPKVILALEKMYSWLVRAEDTIRSETIQVDTIGGLEKQLKLFKELENDLKKEGGNYKYLTSAENQSSGHDSNWNQMINSKVSSVRMKWAHVNVLLKDTIRKLQTLIRILPQFEEETISLTTWIEEASLFLEEPIAFGDLETLESQMEQCSIMAVDIQDTVTERVSEVNSHGDQIVEILNWVDGEKNNHEEQKKTIKGKILSFNQSWNKVSSAAAERQVKIDEAISGTKMLLQLFSRLETKMNQLTSTSRQESDYEDLVSEVNDDLERVSTALDQVVAGKKSLSASIEDMIKKRDLIKRQVQQLVSLKEEERAEEEVPPEIPKHGENYQKHCTDLNENLDRRIKEEEEGDVVQGVSSVLFCSVTLRSESPWSPLHLDHKLFER